MAGCPPLRSTCSVRLAEGGGRWLKPPFGRASAARRRVEQIKSGRMVEPGGRGGVCRALPCPQWFHSRDPMRATKILAHNERGRPRKNPIGTLARSAWSGRSDDLRQDVQHQWAVGVAAKFDAVDHARIVVAVDR